MEFREKRDSVIFTYRYEKELHGKILAELEKRKQKGQKITQPRLILEAFAAFVEAYNEGRIDPAAPTDFRARLNKTDKVTRQLQFPIQPKLILARMAFTFIRSQAEILRMALEWYFRGNLGAEENYMRKYSHDIKKGFIATILYDLFTLNIDALPADTPRSGMIPL